MQKLINGLALGAMLANLANAQTSVDSVPPPPSGSSPPVASPSPNSQTNVQLSQTPVALGNYQGDDLISAFLGALTPACPKVTTDGTVTLCSTSPVSIDSVPYIDNSTNVISGGTLVFTISEGNYTTEVQREGMLALFVQTLRGATTGSNCQNKNYVNAACKPLSPNGRRKIKPRLGTLPPNPGPGTDCEHGSMVMCSGPDNVAIQIVENDKAVAYLVSFSFLFFSPPAPFP